MERNLLPLTEATFYILLSLIGGHKHGYAILQDAAALSGGAVELSTSTLYSALSRMQEQGLIARVENQPGTDNGPGLPRKAYELTRLGWCTLEAELARLHHQVQTAQRLLGRELQP